MKIYKKHIKFSPLLLPNPNFTDFFYFYFSFFKLFLLSKDQTFCFSCLVDKWHSITVSRCINFLFLFPFHLFFNIIITNKLLNSNEEDE